MTEKKVTAENLLNEVINSDLAALEELLALKSPSNVLGSCGEAPLHIAIYKRDRRMLDMLMAAGANIMFPNSNGDTAFHVAVRMGLASFVELLYNSSTDLQRKRLFLQEKNKEGFTALDIASQPVLTSELDLTRKYCAWNSETGTTLDEERQPLQKGRDACRVYLQKMQQVDILAKEIGSVSEMTAQNDSFQKTASVLRGNHFATSSSRIFYSELDYPARLDENAWLESDIKFFLDYLPGVQKVVTKLHAADFVAKTLRSGYDNAQLIQRRGEANSYVIQEQRLRESESRPTIPDGFITNLSKEDSLRAMTGRKTFTSANEEKYYNADGSPKTISQLKTEVTSLEERRLVALQALRAHDRPPMNRVHKNQLEAEGSAGVGKVEEGLYFVNNSHGQPKHDFGQFGAIDKRFSYPINISADDRASTQDSVLRSIKQQADTATRETYQKALASAADRELALQHEMQEYNKHMTFEYKHRL